MMTKILDKVGLTFKLSTEEKDRLKKNQLFQIIFGECTIQIDNATMRDRAINDLFSSIITGHKSKWCHDPMVGETIEERLGPLSVLVRFYLPDPEPLIRRIRDIAIKDAETDYDQDKLNGKANPLDAKVYEGPEASIQGFWME